MEKYFKKTIDKVQIWKYNENIKSKYGIEVRELLNNLKAELVRKNIDPKSGIAKAINCTQRTANNKLNGITPFTVPEAEIIMEKYFKDSDFSIRYLFSDNQKNKPA